MKNSHVLVISYPAQGHVILLMDVAWRFTNNGLKVTFVNTVATHERVMKSWSKKDDPFDLMKLVGIPDGMEPSEDRNDFGKLAETMSRFMPSILEELVNTINKTDDEKFTCIIADYSVGWVSKVAQKMDIRLATFCSGSAPLLALFMSVQKLLDDQVIDRNGVPLKDQMVQLSSNMPFMDPAKFVWACSGDASTHKILFDEVLAARVAAEAADRIICNSIMELEPGVFTLFPKILPIGPLLAANRLKKQVSHFWSEDSTCLAWLDQQPVSSVIYVAFWSFTIFDQPQFEELALGLKLAKKQFLWVVRPGTSGSNDYVYPCGYIDRIGTYGKIVSWAPQQEVLNHPSVACFMSHCGWNSTIEGVSNRVPFLCWPYFADQFL